MKESSRIRASHVNSGTSVDGKKLKRRGVRGREFRHPKLDGELERSDATAYGGLSLAASLLKSLGVPQRLDDSLDILEARRPYTESDHVLTHVYNLFLGGGCLEDIALLQGSEAARRMVGARAVNAAYLVCARLAFNLKSWLAMLALPLEVMRWEWKRFRLAFVYLAARVIRGARRVVVRFADAHRYAPRMLAGLKRLQV